MWREWYRTVTPKLLVMLVPVPVKCPRRIRRSPFSKKQSLLVGHLRQLSSFVWIMQWTDLLHVGIEGLLNLGMERGPGVLQEFKYYFLSWTHSFSIDHSI